MMRAVGGIRRQRFRTYAFMVEGRLITGVVLGACSLSLLVTAAVAADDPGYGYVRCDSPEALTYTDSDVPIPTGHTLSDGTPVCHTVISHPGVPSIHPDALRELVTPPPIALPDEEEEPDPDYVPFAWPTNAAPVPPEEWENYDLVDLGRYGVCGGERKPRDFSENTNINYLCDRATDSWVKVRYARVAYDHEIDWFPAGPCDRQVSGMDPFRNLRVTKRNDAFSQAACDKWLLDTLATEFSNRKAAANGGLPDPYCQIIGIHWYGDNYAYGQVFHNEPDENGNCVSTPVFWGSYADAVNFVATDSRCSQAFSQAAGTSASRSVSGKPVVGDSGWLPRIILRGPINYGPDTFVDQPARNNAPARSNAPVPSDTPAPASTPAGSSQSPGDSPAAPPQSSDEIDYAETASEPCNQPWQIPGSYHPETGCQSR